MHRNDSNSDKAITRPQSDPTKSHSTTTQGKKGFTPFQNMAQYAGNGSGKKRNLVFR